MIIIKFARSLERPNFVRWRQLYCGTGCMLRGILGRFLYFGEIWDPLYLHNFPVKEEQFDSVKWRCTAVGIELALQDSCCLPVKVCLLLEWGERCGSWLRHRAAWRVVPSSIPCRVLGHFLVTCFFCHSISLGSTQPVTEMSTKEFHGGTVRPARGATPMPS